MKINAFLMMMVSFGSLILVSCSQGDNGGRNTLTNNGVYGSNSSCPAGYVYTQQYQCLPQSSSCPANFGYSNGSCYQGISGTNGWNTNYNNNSSGSCPAGYQYYYGTYNGQTGGWCYQQTY